MLVTGFVYEIKNAQGEVVLSGILHHSEDVFYPAQERPDLLEHYPTLPYECEFHHFAVMGLKPSGFYFSTTVKELEKWKD